MNFIMTLPIPLKALSRPGAILGTTGSGKTVTAKLLAEKIMQREIPLPFAAIDPMGVWYGMKLSGDGKSKAFDVVLCGAPHERARKPQPDIPITPQHGAMVADLIADKRLSIIVDLSGFEDDENFGLKAFPDAEEAEEKQLRFIGDFARRLYQRNELPMHLFVDEAHVAAPQTPKAKGSNYSRRMLERIAKQGRSQGIRPTFITQRPAAISKDVIALTDWLIVMRIQAYDEKAVMPYIGGNLTNMDKRALMARITQFPTGEGYVSYPSGDYSEYKKFDMMSTFDSSKTPDETDMDQVIATDLARIDLGDIAALFTAPQVEVNAKIGVIGGIDPKEHKRLLDEATELAHHRGYDAGLEFGREQGARRGAEKLAKQIRAVLDGKHIVELTEISGGKNGR